MTFAMVKGQLQIVDGMWVESLLNEPVDAKPVIIDGKYKVLDIIGQGGMGTVYRAEQLKLGREVALKTFRSKEIPPDVWRRFEREARAVAQLNHENIIKVYDFGITEDNRPYYTMELLSGESLEERLDRQNALSLAELYYIFARVFEALKYTHEKNIVHRDIKPANVFLTLNEGQITGVKLVDFGIAGLVTDMGAVDQKLTETGTIFGSPLYMSPEQSRGENLDARTDIYSCGCMLFECLTGATPYRGKSALETIIMHQSNPVPPLPAKSERQEQIPQWLSQLYGLMMQKDKNNRIGSCGEIFDVMSFQLKQSKSKIAVKNREEKSRETDSPVKVQTKSFLLFSFLTIVFLAAFLLMPTALKSRPDKQEESDNLTNASPSKEQEMEWHFRKIMPNTNRVVFHFPATPIGGIATFSRELFEPAKGFKEYDKDDKICFRTAGAWPADPTDWRRFGPYDLFSVELEDGEKIWEVEHIKELCKLYGLSKLYIGNTNADGKIIDDINKIDSLISLKLRSSKISTKDLLRLKHLPIFVQLSIYDLKDISPILRVLKQKGLIAQLNLTGCAVTDEDCALLAKLKNLRILDLTETTVTPVGLRRLIHAPCLKALYLTDTQIRPEEFADTAKFPGLTYLMVGKNWTPQQIAALRKQRPLLRIEQAGSTSILGEGSLDFYSNPGELK